MSAAGFYVRMCAMLFDVDVDVDVVANNAALSESVERCFFLCVYVVV